MVFTSALMLAISCSGGGENGIAPLLNDRATISEAKGSTACLGFWQVTIDKESGTIDAVDMRSSDLIINVLGFLEPPALKGLTIDFGSLKIADPIIEVDVILTHPIADATFMGFDVRGVVFGPIVTNADGLTVVTCPEFFTGVPFGYKDGLLGPPDSVGHYFGLAGYKYFCDGLAKDDDLAAFMSDPSNLAKRGMFSPSPAKNTRHYVLDWTVVAQPFLVFNYSVYANYDWPSGEAPIDINDFDITTANSQEAFCCKVTELANSLYYAGGSNGGGSISLQVEVWDWQGNINDVTIETMEPGINKTPWDDFGPGTTPKSSIYDFLDVPGTPAKTGDLDILITATDAKTFGESWLMGLLPPSKQKYNEKVYNCFIHTTTVSECPPAVITGINPNGAWSGASLDNATITGTFMDGLQLAVKLKKTDQTDITCTDVQFVSSTTITCDIDLAGAAVGAWDVEVTNGCGTPGTAPGLLTVHASKNLTLRSGVTAYDIGYDHSDGDLLVLYSDGQVWKYTEGGWYQDGASFYSSMAGATYIDVNTNGDSIVGGNDDGTIQYCRSFSSTGTPLKQLQDGWPPTNSYCYRVQDVMAITGSVMTGYHALISSGITIGYDGSWLNRLDPPNYTEGGGNLRPNASGVGNVHIDYIIAMEWSCSTMDRMYILEGDPEFRVEAYNDWYGFTYVYWGGTKSDGMDGFYDPKDITRDNDNYYYVLDYLSTSLPLVKKYSDSGSQEGSCGDTTNISGIPLRIEGGDYDGKIFVLHSNGLSIFLPNELP